VVTKCAVIIIDPMIRGLRLWLTHQSTS